MSNINDMMAFIRKSDGLASSNRFLVQLTPPAFLTDKARDLQFLCETVNLPGVNFNIEEIKMKGYGVAEKRPGSISFDDITCTFFIDNTSICLDFFQEWLNFIFPFDPNNADSGFNGVENETFNYPSEYRGQMTIYFKKKDNQDVTVFEFDSVWPVNVNQVMLGWEQNDTLARLPVTFNYKKHSTKIIKDNSSINAQLNNDDIQSAVNNSVELLTA